MREVERLLYSCNSINTYVFIKFNIKEKLAEGSFRANFYVRSNSSEAVFVADALE
jgi:hypothetical protein